MYRDPMRVIAALIVLAGCSGPSPAAEFCDRLDRGVAVAHVEMFPRHDESPAETARKVAGWVAQECPQQRSGHPALRAYLDRWDT